MNGKKIACLVLLMIVATVVYGTQTMGKRASSLQAEAETKRSDAEMARSQCETSNISLIRLKDDTKEIRQFLGTWTPVINRLQSSQDAEQALLVVVRNSGIFVAAQKYEAKDVHGNALMPKMLQGSITVQDEFAKTMNWLGELECKIPLIRITSCKITQGDTGRQVNVELHFEIPLFDLAANIDKK